jgi:rare lipoprotein A
MNWTVPSARTVSTSRVARCISAVVVGLIVSASMTAPAAVQRHNRSVETGFATFYSRLFEGKKTASGRRFDGDALVAAHRTLPFGTVVSVTNLENGRKVTVQIIDRGPYGDNWREGTVIDLSPAAAKQLDMLEDGQVRARVSVVRLGSGRRSPTPRQ